SNGLQHAAQAPFPEADTTATCRHPSPPKLMPSRPADDHAIDNTSSQYPAHERSRGEQKPSSRARHHHLLPCSQAAVNAVNLEHVLGVVVMFIWTAPSCDSSPTLWHYHARSWRHPPHQTRPGASWRVSRMRPTFRQHRPCSASRSQLAQKIDYRGVNLRRTLLLGPMTATRKHDLAAQLRHVVCQIRD